MNLNSRRYGLSRREFLKVAAAGLGGLFLFPSLPQLKGGEFPAEERLGRVLGGRVPVKLRPDIDSPDVGQLYDDDVVLWLREVVGKRPLWYSQRFVETPQGYVYAPNLQPVMYQPNQPVEELTDPKGMWVEVTVPYVDLVLQNPPARSPWLKHTTSPRLYFSQVMLVDAIKKEGQQVYYRVKELYGTFGDVFWAPAEAFRIIQPDEITPIHPDVEEKFVQVNLLQQTLSCFEGKQEVYFCRVSTGGKYDAEGNVSDKWATPVGSHTIWRKLVSVHMTGGTTGGGYDLPGIGWTVLFSGNGVAVHSTFWHNSFGIPRSHGCVNAAPADAKWIFRWTLPDVAYHPGDVTISGKGSSKVIVVE
jgi:lipoprotein-anchoring transpeptidase ErfK/SrfK